MKNLYTFKLALFLICFNSCAQEKQNCKVELEQSIAPFITSLNEARDVYKTTKQNYLETIKTKTEKLNEISNALPHKYGGLKVKSDKIESLISDFNLFIESLKNESKTNHFDNYNYVMMSDTLFYQNILFDKENNLSESGLKLKEKIDFLYKTNNEILNSFQHDLKVYNDSKFKTDIIFNDYNGNKIDYIDYNISNRTVIGVLTYLEKLQLELVTFQFLYMNSIIQ